MSIQASICTATASVVGGRVYPWGEVPEDAPYPLIVYRRTLNNPIMTLLGYSGTTISEFVFECWGAETESAEAKANALTAAQELTDAIEAAKTGTLSSQWRTQISGEDFDDQTLKLMEPCGFGFSHS